MEEFKPVDFTVVVDTREQAPWKFKNIKGDKSDSVRVKTPLGPKPSRLVVPTLIVSTTRKAMKTGDYSIEGLEDRVAIERKSLEDLFGCVGGDRNRFEKQLSRLNEMEFGAMVIEADWQRVLRGLPQSQLKPKTVLRSVIAWQMNYFPNIHWWFAPGVRLAELFSFRMLDRFWKKKDDKKDVKTT